ncbi:hypothetical protein Acr_23g0020010 [Actinidia rufa]|uniref:Uncharacterized protein n=1 Tax=Actinidia rufa TaxID=165716 RepID=A0A7J0GS35_9ERIC|nr:hypothetical protein Acr_23g0020010 [Actinidia rufa]
MNNTPEAELTALQGLGPILREASKISNCRTFESGSEILPNPFKACTTTVTKRACSSSPKTPSPPGFFNDEFPYSELWAGPAYSNSPPPSSLPMPKFSLPPKRTISLNFPASPASDMYFHAIAKSAPPSPRGTIATLVLEISFTVLTLRRRPCVAFSILTLQMNEAEELLGSLVAGWSTISRYCLDDVVIGGHVTRIAIKLFQKAERGFNGWEFAQVFDFCSPLGWVQETDKSIPIY